MTKHVRSRRGLRITKRWVIEELEACGKGLTRLPVACVGPVELAGVERDTGRGSGQSVPSETAELRDVAGESTIARTYKALRRRAGRGVSRADKEGL